MQEVTSIFTLNCDVCLVRGRDWSGTLLRSAGRSIEVFLFPHIGVVFSITLTRKAIVPNKFEVNHASILKSYFQPYVDIVSERDRNFAVAFEKIVTSTCA